MPSPHTLYYVHQHRTPMITQQDREFVDFLFGKLTKHVDMEMVDLHDDDTAGIDALEFEQLTLID